MGRLPFNVLVSSRLPGRLSGHRSYPGTMVGPLWACPLALTIKYTIHPLGIVGRCHVDHTYNLHIPFYVVILLDHCIRWSAVHEILYTFYISFCQTMSIRLLLNLLYISNMLSNSISFLKHTNIYITLAKRFIFTTSQYVICRDILCHKRRRSSPSFSRYLWKTWGGCSNTPGPARANWSKEAMLSVSKEI